MTDQTLGQKICTERKQLGLSQEALGEKLGVSRQAISKWEADGAIPEIDKLISLSRLFGVSVGWLLGEEDVPAQPEPAPTPALTAKQVVRNHLADHPWWRTGCWIIIALCAVFIAFTSWHRMMRIFGYDVSLSITQSDVDRLEHKLQQMEAMYLADPQSGPLLSRYDFSLSFSESAPESAVTFTGVPNSWQENDEAFLSILGNGIRPLHVPCQWDGEALTAELTLPFADGYELHFTQTHADGSQQSHPLYHGTLEALKASCAITSFGSVEKSSWKRGENTLLLENFQYSCRRPDLYTESPVTWQKIQLVLYRDGVDIWQRTDFDAAVRQDSTLTTGGIGSQGHLQLTLGDVKFEPGQILELKLHTALSNTVTGECTIASWTADSRGIPQLNTPD